MRPEHSETKAKTETRECETEIETETETSPFKSIACDSNTNRYVSFYYTHEVNDEPEIDFAFKIITK